MAPKKRTGGGKGKGKGRAASKRPRRNARTSPVADGPDEPYNLQARRDAGRARKGTQPLLHPGANILYCRVSERRGGIKETVRAQKGEGHKVVHDSRTHLYDREVGFKKSETDERLEKIDARIQDARKRLASDVDAEISSFPDLRYKWSVFERYCITHHEETSAFTQQLIHIEALMDGTPDLKELKRDRLKFIAPEDGVVDAFIDHMRHGEVLRIMCH